jgi:hypothetical protein
LLSIEKANAVGFIPCVGCGNVSRHFTLPKGTSDDVAHSKRPTTIEHPWDTHSCLRRSRNRSRHQRGSGQQLVKEAHEAPPALQQELIPGKRQASHQQTKAEQMFWIVAVALLASAVKDVSASPR